MWLTGRLSVIEFLWKIEMQGEIETSEEIGLSLQISRSESSSTANRCQGEVDWYLLDAPGRAFHPRQRGRWCLRQVADRVVGN